MKAPTFNFPITTACGFFVFAFEKAKKAEDRTFGQKLGIYSITPSNGRSARDKYRETKLTGNSLVYGLLYTWDALGKNSAPGVIAVGR